MIRLGFVGAGLIWENVHRRIVSAMRDEVSPSAFCARSEETRAALQRGFPDALLFGDWRHLVRSPEIDAVVVLTPIPLNAPVAIAALEAGKPVLLEKPVARGLAEARTVADAERRSGKRIYMLEQAPYAPVLSVMRRVIDGGQIGEPICFERVSLQFLDRVDDSSGGYGRTAWRQEPDFPLGLLFDAGIHDLAALGTLFGAPMSVFARGRRVRPEFGPYDWTVALIEYRNGVCGTYSHSGFLGGRRSPFIIRCERGLLQYEEGRLTLETKLPQAVASVSSNADGDRLQYAAMELALPPESDYEAMWRHCVDCLRNDRAPDYTLRSAVGDMALMEAIDRSLRTGASAAPER